MRDSSKVGQCIFASNCIDLVVISCLNNCDSVITRNYDVRKSKLFWFSSVKSSKGCVSSTLLYHQKS